MPKFTLWSTVMYIITTHCQMNRERINKSMYVTNPCPHEFKQVPKIFHSNTLITVFNQICTNHFSTKIPVVTKINPISNIFSSL